MAKVYLVTSGSYSKYSISAAFSTKELAKAYIKSSKYSGLDVEEVDLDPDVELRTQMGTIYYGCCHDCRKKIDLGKFYSWSFIREHNGHRLGVYTEHDECTKSYATVHPWSAQGDRPFTAQASP